MRNYSFTEFVKRSANILSIMLFCLVTIYCAKTTRDTTKTLMDSASPDKGLYGKYLMEKNISKQLQAYIFSDEKLQKQLMPYDNRKKYGVYNLIKRFGSKENTNVSYYLNHQDYFSVFYFAGGISVEPSEKRLKEIEEVSHKSKYGALIRVDYLNRILAGYVDEPFSESDEGIGLDYIWKKLFITIDKYGSRMPEIIEFRNRLFRMLDEFEKRAFKRVAWAKNECKKLKRTSETKDISKETCETYIRLYGTKKEIVEYYDNYRNKIADLFK